MIRRRLIALVVLTTALFVFAGGAASADNGNVLCLYAKDPKPGIGLCIGV